MILVNENNEHCFSNSSLNKFALYVTDTDSQAHSDIHARARTPTHTYVYMGFLLHIDISNIISTLSNLIKIYFNMSLTCFKIVYVLISFAYVITPLFLKSRKNSVPLPKEISIYALILASQICYPCLLYTSMSSYVFNIKNTI